MPSPLDLFTTNTSVLRAIDLVETKFIVYWLCIDDLCNFAAINISVCEKIWFCLIYLLRYALLVVMSAGPVVSAAVFLVSLREKQMTRGTSGSCLS